MTTAIWLLKTEPDAFSLEELAARGDAGEPWNGIRNYQARNFLRQMSVGDSVLVYHSACKVPGVVGEAVVIRSAYPDPDALEPNSPYFDAKSTPEANRWSVVDVRYVRHFRRTVTLQEIKKDERLAGMALLKQSRLSVSPVTEKEYRVLSSLSD